MKLQKQGNGECLLASVCMLMGWHIWRGRVRFILSTGSRYSRAIRTTEGWHMIRTWVGRMTGLEIPYACLSTTPGRRGPHLAGRGILIVFFSGSTYEDHAVAYEDHRVYDPNGWVGPWERYLEYAEATYGDPITSWWRGRLPIGSNRSPSIG